LTAIPLEALGKDIREKIAAADGKVGTTADMLAEAARMLLEAKTRIAETRETTFKAFLQQNGIGRSRAFELLAIAEGKKTIVGMRAASAERQARHRETNKAARESVSHGLTGSIPVPAAELSAAYSRGINAIAKVMHDAYFRQAEVFRERHSADHVREEIEGAIEEFMAEQVDLSDLVKIVELAAFGRLVEFFSLHCNRFQHDAEPPEWIRHDRELAARMKA
jgi:hypothetical protein